MIHIEEACSDYVLVMLIPVNDLDPEAIYNMSLGMRPFDRTVKPEPGTPYWFGWAQEAGLYVVVRSASALPFGDGALFLCAHYRQQLATTPAPRNHPLSY